MRRHGTGNLFMCIYFLALPTNLHTNRFFFASHHMIAVAMGPWATTNERVDMHQEGRPVCCELSVCCVDHHYVYVERAFVQQQHSVLSVGCGPNRHQTQVVYIQAYCLRTRGWKTRGAPPNCHQFFKIQNTHTGFLSQWIFVSNLLTAAAAIHQPTLFLRNVH